jgi:hypothetical protein
VPTINLLVSTDVIIPLLTLPIAVLYGQITPVDAF